MLALEKELPIYTADLETDPFEYGLLVEAFVCGFFDGEKFVYFWGDDWLDKFVSYLATIPKGIIYFHNGGKFDFFHMLEIFRGKAMIINGRIIKAESKLKHEFRDSFALMPFALKNYKKDDIDYNKLKKNVRNKHRKEILHYLESDCVYLYELCVSFRNTFGSQLTIGSTSMKELMKVHKFECFTEQMDTEIRSLYYYGGRVQCFKKGVIKTPVKIVDVNSMYPFVMRDYKHPIGRATSETKKIQADTCFISCQGKNYGAFPVREKNGGIRFDKPDGVFHVTIHEWRTAIRYGLFEPDKIIRCINYESRSSFAKFVNKFYNLRNEAKANGDVTNAIFYKYVLNSAYGKFAQNPKNYFDYKITGANEVVEDWSPSDVIEDSHIIWKHPSKHFTRFNVATAASITGAARSVLLEGIAKATKPLYCDTDSIICEDIEGVKIDDTELGAWKSEGDGHTVAIAGKKLYAVFSHSCPECKGSIKKPKLIKGKKCDKQFHIDGCSKQANKGVKITADEIVRVCEGETITSKRIAPSYKLSGKHVFISRRVRML